MPALRSSPDRARRQRSGAPCDDTAARCRALSGVGSRLTARTAVPSRAVQLMKTSCGASAVMRGSQHEGAGRPREFFAFMSGDDPARAQAVKFTGLTQTLGRLSRPLIGILGQTAGSTRKLWVNPLWISGPGARGRGRVGLGRRRRRERQRQRIREIVIPLISEAVLRTKNGEW